MNRSKGITLIEVLACMTALSILSVVLFPMLSHAKEQAQRSGCAGNSKQLSMGILLYSQDYDETLPVLGRDSERRGRWMWQMLPYVKSQNVFTCPLLAHNHYDGLQWSGRVGYGFAEELWGKRQDTRFATGYKLSEIGQPAATIAIGDTGLDQTEGYALYRAPGAAVSGDLHPGNFAQFRHLHKKTRLIHDLTSHVDRVMPLDGLCNFVFLDGHTRAMNSAQTYKTADSENGIPLTDGDRYVLWNRD